MDKEELLFITLVCMENLKLSSYFWRKWKKNIWGSMYLACIGNKPENIQYLLTLSLPFDVEPMDRNGLTLLHLAAKHGHDNVVHVVLDASLEHKININAFDFENKTLFAVACMNGHLEVAKMMIYQSSA